MNIDIRTMSTMNTRMEQTIHKARHTTIFTNMRRLCMTTRIIPIFIIDTVNKTRAAYGQQEEQPFVMPVST